MSKNDHVRTYRDLQEHIELLDKAGLLHRIERPINKDTEMHPLVRWQFCGGISQEERRGFLFSSITDGKKRSYPGFKVGVGVLSSNPAIYSIGMNCPESEIGQRWLKAIANPVPVRPVDKAVCQEVVLTGKDVSGEGKGLEALPIPVSTPGFDTAPYFTAGLWITRNPDTGIQNMGLYRGNLKASDRLCVMTEKATLAGAYVHWKRYRELKKPMPVAIVLGAPPVVEYTGPQKLPLDVDELTVAGGLAGGPVNVVKCITSDLLVPAEANVIVEGLVDIEFLEPEGPFGESHGYIQIEEYNFIVKVTAITRRKDAIISSIISQVTPSESSVIKRLAYEPLYLSHLRDALGLKGVKRVCMHEPLTNLRKIVTVVVDRNMAKTEIWRMFEGVSSLQPAVGKICIAVNEDINPDNTDAILWAIAYRCNPVEDVHITPYRALGHAPHTSGPGIESTMFIDATLKFDMPPVALPKKEYMENARKIWEKLGLPALKPQEPWFGYSLGIWCDAWDECAARAAAGDWTANGLRSGAASRRMEEPQTFIEIAEAEKFGQNEHKTDN
ncbi:MAG: UbiD family decarboxylase [Lentisphaerota bacterium]